MEHMKTYHGWNYNVFQVEELVECWIFDNYRQVKVKTPPCNTRDEAIRKAHKIIKNLNKGFPYPGGIIVDDGKDIREKELSEIKEKKRNGKKNRKGIQNNQ